MRWRIFGVVFLITPVLRLVIDEESMLAILLKAVWLNVVLIVLGLLMLGLGVLSMLQVQSLIKEQETQV